MHANTNYNKITQLIHEIIERNRDYGNREKLINKYKITNN